MSGTVDGIVAHEEVNKLVRLYKGKLAGPLISNLKKLRLQIYEALNGEENYHVYIYISDELENPIKLENGSGANELVINIEADGIQWTWTKRSWWNKIIDFFKAAVGIIDALRSLWIGIKAVGSFWGGITALGGTVLKAIGWVD